MRGGSYIDADTDDGFLDADDLAYEDGRTWSERLAARGRDTSDLSRLADDLSRESGTRRLTLPPRIDH